MKICELRRVRAHYFVHQGHRFVYRARASLSLPSLRKIFREMHDAQFRRGSRLLYRFRSRQNVRAQRMELCGNEFLELFEQSSERVAERGLFGDETLVLVESLRRDLVDRTVREVRGVHAVTQKFSHGSSEELQSRQRRALGVGGAIGARTRNRPSRHELFFRPASESIAPRRQSGVLRDKPSHGERRTISRVYPST